MATSWHVKTITVQESGWLEAPTQKPVQDTRRCQQTDYVMYVQVDIRKEKKFRFQHAHSQYACASEAHPEQSTWQLAVRYAQGYALLLHS